MGPVAEALLMRPRRVTSIVPAALSVRRSSALVSHLPGQQDRQTAARFSGCTLPSLVEMDSAPLVVEPNSILVNNN